MISLLCDGPKDTLINLENVDITNVSTEKMYQLLHMVETDKFALAHTKALGGALVQRIFTIIQDHLKKIHQRK